MKAFIINGNSRAGKDCFVDAIVRQGKRLGDLRVARYSVIDPVRKALIDMGVDIATKSERDRRLMAEVGDALERHSSFKSASAVAFVHRSRLEGASATFLFVRDIHVMRTIEAMLADSSTPIVVRRVLVTRPEATLLLSNNADAGINNIAYDVEIRNDGDLAHLDLLAEAFVKELIGSETPALSKWKQNLLERVQAARSCRLFGLPVKKAA